MKYIDNVGPWRFETNKFKRVRYTENRFTPTILSRAVDVLSTNDSIDLNDSMSIKFHFKNQIVNLSKNLLVLNYPTRDIFF